MKLTSGQLAKLRQLGRASNELDQRHAARRAAIQAQRDYLLELRRQRQHADGLLTAIARASRSGADHDHASARHAAEVERVDAEVEHARVELEQLQGQLGEITEVNAPLRELLDRICRHANVSRREAGIAFDDDRDAPRESVGVG